MGEQGNLIEKNVENTTNNQKLATENETLQKEIALHLQEKQVIQKNIQILSTESQEMKNQTVVEKKKLNSILDQLSIESISLEKLQYEIINVENAIVNSTRKESNLKERNTLLLTNVELNQNKLNTCTNTLLEKKRILLQVQEE